jgi:hypothetical protein
MVRIKGEPYLERWFVYLLGFTLRLHKFYRGDDDRAVHDHPWPFITFPFRGYWERVREREDNQIVLNYVHAWRFHRRPSRYQHWVIGPLLFDDGKQFPPCFTFVMTGRKDRSWGFYPGGEYMYWQDYNRSYNADAHE